MQRRPRLTLALAVLAAFAAAAVFRFITLDAVRLTPSPVARAAMSDIDAPSIGSAKPDVTIIVFTDYQCPICKATDPALERLAAQDGGVRVVYKHWPIFGPVSDRAARLAISAQRQGRFADFHRALMENRTPLSPERIEEIAVSVGLDWPRLVRDTAEDADQLTARLRANVRQAWSLGVRGTPAYLVGPLLIHGGLDEHHLAEAVRQARQAQRQASSDEP